MDSTGKDVFIPCPASALPLDAHGHATHDAPEASDWHSQNSLFLSLSLSL